MMRTPFVLLLGAVITLSAVALLNTSSASTRSRLETFVKRLAGRARPNNGMRFTNVAATIGGMKKTAKVAQPLTGRARPASDKDSVSPEQYEILRKYAKTTEHAERTSLAALLTQTVAKQFSARQENRLKELQRLEEQLKRLQSIQERRDKEKARIVDTRVQQLLRDADGLGWGSGGESSNGRKANNTKEVSPSPVRLPQGN